MFIPTYKEDSLTVLIGTVGFGQISAESHSLHDLDFRTLPGHSAPVQFSPSDVGLIAMVLGAGVAGSNLVCKISVYVSPTAVTLDTAASTTAIPGTANVIVFRPAKVKEASISATDSVTSRGQCQFTVQTTAANVCPVEGQPYLLISSDPDVGTDTYGAFMGGEIDKVTTPNQPGATGYYESECECVGYEAICSRRLMRGKEYSSQTMAQVVADIVANGLQAEFVDVDCPTGPTVDLVTVSDLSYVSDALDQLLQGLSDPTVGYFWKTTPYRKIKVGQALAVTSPWHISDADITDKNVLVSVSQARSRDKLSNQVYVQDSHTLADPATVFTFKNPANRPFGGVALPDTPPFAPTVTVNGVPQTVETVDPADSDKWVLTNFALAKWSWVKGTTGLRPTPPAAIPVGGTLVAVYRKSYDSLSLRTFDDGLSGFGVQARSAIQGGSGLHESVVSLDNPMTQAVLDTKAANLARQLGIVPSEVTVETYRGGLKAGQALFIRLTDINVVNTYLVAESAMTTADGYVKWSVRAVYGSAMGDYITALASALSGSLPIGVGGVPIGSPLPNPDLFLQFAGTSGMRGVAYSATLHASGGNPGYTYSIASGSLPAGLALNTSTGAITGTPTVNGDFTIIFEVTDSLAQTALATATISIAVPDTSGAVVTGLVAKETPRGVYRDAGGGIHTQVEFDLTIVAAVYPVPVRNWVDFADGRGPVLLGDKSADGATATFNFGEATQDTGVTNPVPGSIWKPTDPTRTNWIAYAEANGLDNLPSGSAVSYAFTVPAVAALTPSAISNIQFIINPDTADTIDYVKVDPGTWYWIFHEIDFLQPATGPDGNPDFKSSFITVQKGWNAVGACTVTGGVNVESTSGEPFLNTDVGDEIRIADQLYHVQTYTDPTHAVLDSPAPDGSGQPYEVWRPAPDREGVSDPNAAALGYIGRQFTEGGPPHDDSRSLVQVIGQPEWDMPTGTNLDGSVNHFRDFIFRVYGVSRRADNERGGVDTVTLQIWLDGKDHGILTPQLQAAAVDATRLRSNTLGSGLKGGGGISVQISYGAALADDGTGKAAVQVAGPFFVNLSNSLDLHIAADFVVASVGGVLTLTQAVVDLAKAANFNTAEFQVSGGVYLMKALAVNKLIAGDALFAGTATFAYQDPITHDITGRVTLNAFGMTFADAYPTPSSTVAIGATGTTISKVGTSMGTLTAAITSTGATTLTMSVNAPVNGSYIWIDTEAIKIVSGGGTTTPVIARGQLGTTAATHTNGSQVKPNYSVEANSNGIAVYGPTGSVIITAAGVTISNGILNSPTISVTGPGAEIIQLDSTNGLVVSNAAGTSIATLNDGILEVSNPLSAFGGSLGDYRSDGFTVLGANADGAHAGHGCRFVGSLGNISGSISLTDENGLTVVLLAAGSLAPSANGITISNGGHLQTTSGSLLTQYNGIATAGLGLAPIYSLVALTGQTAAIGATNILIGGGMAPAGSYRLTIRLPISVAGTGGSIELRIISTDGVSRTQLVLSALATTTATCVFTTMPVRTDGSAHIQYSITFNAVTGSPQYGLDVSCEQIS